MRKERKAKFKLSAKKQPKADWRVIDALLCGHLV